MEAWGMTRTFLLCVVGCLLWAQSTQAQIDLQNASVVVEKKALRVPAEVLVEEVAKRTDITWKIGRRAGSGGAIVLRLAENNEAIHSEGFRIQTETSPAPRITITAAGRRGALFGVGYLLRKLEWGPSKVGLAQPLNVDQAPQYEIRGHQLGYRAQANSYDAWDAATFDQYIREMAFFGTNCVENIPFQDERPTPIMPLTREQMNRKMGEICAKYDIDYWVWTPADFDLLDAEKRAAALKFHEKFYRDCPRLDAIFFPGGDPGDNHPREVMPFLEDLSKILPKYHPDAQIWMSLQGFEGEKTDYFFTWLNEHKPAWLGGVVAGPGSPPLPELRERLDKRYKLRDYPDITHVVRAQHPEPNLDQVFALTAGREPINPRPMFYSALFAKLAPSTNGFLSYSDGCHDDVNKAIWSGLGWDSSQAPRDILVDYARCFFGPADAEKVADGILAIEKNWDGSLRDNAGVPKTYELWKGLEAAHPELADNWRWQMLLIRSYYDHYQRERLARETALEQQAYQELVQQPGRLPTSAMERAMEVLDTAVTQPTQPELRNRLIQLFDQLYTSIKFQSSVEKYHAIHPQRGCMLDFLDYPLNNRFWLEDQFDDVATLPTLEARWAKLEELRQWETPGEGSFYDDIGHVGRSPHVRYGDEEIRSRSSFWWWDNGMSRLRLSWLVTGNPDSLQYDNLDPKATYVLRFSGFGDLKPKGDDQPLTASVYNVEEHTLKEFPVPREMIQDGELTVTFDSVRLEGVNWRYQPRLAEAWLLKNPTSTITQEQPKKPVTVAAGGEK